MKFSNQARVHGVSLAAYIVCDILLTPPAHLETRPPARVTAIGDVVLGLLFVGLALAILALVMLVRRSRRAPAVAMVAAVLFLPAFIAEQTRSFSALNPPAAIEAIEVVQVLVVVVVVVAALWLFRSSEA